MKSSEKYFTFLYVPSNNTGLKTVRVPKLLVYALGTTVAVLLVASTVAVLKYASKFNETYKVAQLSDQNDVLTAQLGELNNEVTQLRSHVQKNFDFQKRARLLANLDDLNPDVTEVGIGGPNFGYVQSLSVLDEKSRNSLMHSRADIGKLIRQAKLQSDSYGEILEVLTENQKLLNSTPSIRPVPRGYVSSRFGPRMDPITGRSSRHLGVDFSARLGTPIVATGDGIITYSGKWGDFGQTVEISHGFDYVTRYAHCSKLLVKKGQKVKRGDVIARVGSSGRSTATHVHYEVLHKGKKKNPLAYVVSNDEITD